MRRDGGWVSVHFAFDPPIRGPGSRTVFVEYLLTDGVCGGGRNKEMYYADWVDEWQVPISASNFSLQFDPSINSELLGTCAASAEGTSCVDSSVLLGQVASKPPLLMVKGR